MIIDYWFGVLYSEENKNMSEQIIAVIVGAVIGSLSSLVTALFLFNLSDRRRRKSIQAIAAAEVTTIMERLSGILTSKVIRRNYLRQPLC